MKINTTARAFKCPACSEKVYAFKKSSKRTSAGHIKTMYCWKCKRAENFIQLPNYLI